MQNTELRKLKIKPTLTFVFLISFAIYNLCPVLMQGDCGPRLSGASSLGESSRHCHRATATPQLQWDVAQRSESKYHIPQRGDGAEHPNAPRPDSLPGEKCCFIGMELVRPNQSDTLNQHLPRTFLPCVIIPRAPALHPVGEAAAFRPHPFINLYDCFFTPQTSPRAPPAGFSLQLSHI